MAAAMAINGGSRARKVSTRLPRSAHLDSYPIQSRRNELSSNGGGGYFFSPCCSCCSAGIIGSSSSRRVPGGGRPRRRRRAAAAGDGGRRQVPAAGAGPVVRLLQEELPGGGVHRAGLFVVGGAAERGARGGADPAALPRLLRAGLRRLHPAGLDAHPAQRAGVGAQPVAPAGGVQGRQRHPRAPRAGLRPRRLLRRHRRARRPGIRCPGRRSVLHGAPWPSRRSGAGVGRGRAGRAPAADVDGADAAVVPGQDQAGRDGPGGAVGRPHGGARALRLLPQPPLPDAGPDAQQVLRGPAVRDVPDQRVQQHEAQRRADAQRLRQQVLRGPAEPGGPLHVGPGPAHQRHHQASGHQVRRRPGRLLRPVRLLVRQDGADRRAHGRAGTGPRKLLRAQQQRRRGPAGAGVVVRRGDRRRRRRQPRALARSSYIYIVIQQHRDREQFVNLQE